MITALVVCLLAQLDAGPRPIEPRVDVDAGVAVDTVVFDADVADAGVVDEVAVDAGPAALPAGWALSARVEPARVAFGGEVQLVVEVTRPARVQVGFPDELGANDALPRTARKPIRAAKERGDGTVTETITFGFLALDVKDLKTPAFTLTVSDGTVLDVPSLPVAVDVTPLADPTDGGSPEGALLIEPAAGAVLYRVDDARPWAVLALILLVVTAVLTLRAAIKARVVDAPIVVGPPPPPPRPAHEVALERLDALLPMLTRGEVDSFVALLMDDVLRDYLAGRFALAAGTRTTKEIVTDLLSVAVVGLDIGLVEQLGRDADLVKFARAHLAAEQASGMAARVRALIIATAAKPQTTSSTVDGGTA